MKGGFKISVIISAYNAASTIAECIESVLKSDYSDFEVIVVDDASSDKTSDIVSSFSCKLIKLNNNAGPGEARNIGAAAASGGLFAFTDADCRVSGNWLKNIAENFKKYNILAVTGGYSKSLNNNFTALFQFYDTGFRQRTTAIFIDSVNGSNFACRKEIFFKTGGFPKIKINEDMELGRILADHGKILWDKKNGVAHYFPFCPAVYFKKQFLWTESVAVSFFSGHSVLNAENTWRPSYIILNLAASFLTAVFFILSVFNIKFFILAALFFLMHIVINSSFLFFLFQKEGAFFSLKACFFSAARNIVWLGGLIKGSLKSLKIKLLK